MSTLSYKERICPECGLPLPVPHGRTQRLHTHCAKARKVARYHKFAVSEKGRAYHRQAKKKEWQKRVKAGLCPKCGTINNSGGVCQPCILKSNHPQDLRIELLSKAKNRAKQRGLEFNLTTDDVVVPTHCPVFGIELKRNIGKRGPHNNSPTLDRIDNTKGYIKGNVVVVSWRANHLKSNASLDELRMLAEFYTNL